jgi:hypothetical protein
MSLAVITASTPGSASAFEVSIDLMRALADPFVVRIFSGHVIRPVPFGEACKIVHQSELVVTARSSTMRVRGSLKEGGHNHAA